MIADLSTSKHFSLIRAVRNRLKEDDDTQRAVDIQQMSDRAMDLEAAGDNAACMAILSGPGRESEKWHAWIGLALSLCGDYEDEEDGATAVDVNPSTRPVTASENCDYLIGNRKKI